MIATTKVVEQILEANIEARNDDPLLYSLVIQRMNNSIANIPVGIFFKNFYSYKLPSYDAVSRCRRKIQRSRIELSGDPEVESARMELEEEYKDWSKES